MLEIINTTKFRVPVSRIQRDMGILFSLLHIPAMSTCEVIVVGSRRMRAINAAYGFKRYSTTVLSFSVPKRFVTGPHRHLGEIYVCVSDMKKQGLTFNPRPARPSASAWGAGYAVHKSRVGFYPVLIYYILHGLLHLIGYDHEGSEVRRKRMEKKEQSLWHKLCGA